MKRIACRHIAALATGWLCLGLHAMAADEKLPDLLPARGELPPTFWELHGWAIAMGALALMAATALVIILLTRSGPKIVIPPETIARRALEAMRGQNEDGDLLARVSQILRHYVMFACEFSLRERTTAELCQELETSPRYGGELAKAVADFLRQCDRRKFSLEPPAAPAPVVETALGLVAQVEARRKEAKSATPPPLPKSVVMAHP